MQANVECSEHEKSYLDLQESIKPVYAANEKLQMVCLRSAETLLCVDSPIEHAGINVVKTLENKASILVQRKFVLPFLAWRWIYAVSFQMAGLSYDI